MNYYESPFHATETLEVAARSILKTETMIKIRSILEQKGLSVEEQKDVLTKLLNYILVD